LTQHIWGVILQSYLLCKCIRIKSTKVAIILRRKQAGSDDWFLKAPYHCGAFFYFPAPIIHPRPLEVCCGSPKNWGHLPAWIWRWWTADFSAQAPGQTSAQFCANLHRVHQGRGVSPVCGGKTYRIGSFVESDPNPSIQR
jgi:hypothetical protein